MSYNGGRRIYVDADGYEHMDIDHDEPTNRITNGDKIRAMTDEELADLFVTWVWDCDCNDVPCREYCLPNRYDCVKNWLDWLKQEARE